MSKRREFTRDQKAAIVERAKINGVIRCEGCGLALKSGAFEIDHIIAEGLRTVADKKRKLTLAEGQLLGKTCCHRGEDGKTKIDVANIAQAKRREARDKGIKQPKRSIARPPKPVRVSRPSLPPRQLYARGTET